MAEHTPGPWRVEHRRIGDTLFNEQRVYDPKGDYTATFDTEPLFDWFVEPVRLQVGDKANAEHIVRCVNSHDDLLAAAEAIYRVAEDADLPGPVYLSIAERNALKWAIDKARGR